MVIAGAEQCAGRISEVNCGRLHDAKTGWLCKEIDVIRQGLRDGGQSMEGDTMCF